MIVTIDGPAGAGKSTVARELAARLGFRFLDTGATYRAVTLAAVRQRLDWNQPDALAALAAELDIQLDDDHVLLDGEDVTETIRSPEITSLTRHAAGNPQVREHLVRLQRRAAAGRDVVTEGRDQGTVAFPDAQCKIYLTATAEERAKRRLRDLQQQGEQSTLDEVLAGQNQRDQRDENRDCGPLVQAKDAVEVVTDGLSLEQVVDRLETLVRQRM